MQRGGPAGAERNRWPDDLEGFRETMAEFFDAFGRLSSETMALVHRVLGLPDSVIATHDGSPAVSTVRLNHYPVGDPVPTEERGDLAALGDVALGHHTDPGVITLLLQDDRGGLQTETRSGEWIDVPPERGTIVVNLADCVQVWTNDRYRAAVHRVVPMTTGDRYSIPYFFNPDVEAQLRNYGRRFTDDRFNEQASLVIMERLRGVIMNKLILGEAERGSTTTTRTSAPTTPR